jgi:archaemetzincin
MQIALVPIGDVDSSLLSRLGEALSEEFSASFFVAEPLPNPAYAFNLRREQYLSTSILRRLGELDLPKADRILGVVDLDLYVPELNFVFGQASMKGKEAIIALPRLRQSFYGLPEDPDLFQQRMVKEAVHELGHTLGLGHCPNNGCVMHFSNSLRDTDIKGKSFCASCRAQLGD